MTGDTNSYWDHVAAQGGQEASRANPDILAESAEDPEPVDLLPFKKFLRKEIKKLNPRAREILLLCGAKGLTAEVVADMLGTSQQNVQQTFVRNIEKIRCKYLKTGV